MKDALDHKTGSEWFAIKTKQDFEAERRLRPLCEEVFFPKEVVARPDKKARIRAVIPHVLFIKTTREHALQLETNARQHPETVTFWIYRYPKNDEIQVIPQESIDLLRLLTADTSVRCEIFNKTDFKKNEHVRITGGTYKGYEGYVQRVRKNKHVIVRIEGICLVMLPFIAPDLLEKIDGTEATAAENQ